MTSTADPADGSPAAGIGRRRLATALAGLLGLFLAWQVVAMALVQTSADDHPGMVLRFAPRSQTTLDSDAVHRFAAAKTPADLAAARRSAARALGVSPLEVAAARQFALASESQMQAQAVMSFAGSLSHRDLTTEAWLLQNALERQAWPQAMRHADALLRADPSRAKLLAPALIYASLQSPDARRALAAAMAAPSAWRGGLLADFAKSSPDPDLLGPLVADVGAAGGRLEDAEIAPALAALVQRGAAEQAYAVWSQQLPPSALAALSNVYDGSFRGLPGPEPFNWTFTQPASGVVERGKPSGAGDTALKVQLDGDVSGDLAAEDLVLAPGRYTLSGRLYGDDAADGVQAWAIACTGSSPIVRTTPAPLARSWTSFQVDFEVPAAGCRSQRLELLAGPRPDGARESLVWWTDLAIEPVHG